MFLESSTTTHPNETDVKKEVNTFIRQVKVFLDKEIDLEKEAVGYLNSAVTTDGTGALGRRDVINELKHYLRREIDLKKEAILYLNGNGNRLNLRHRTPVKKEEQGFMKVLKALVNKEVRLRIDGDSDPHDYTLKEVRRDYVVLAFGHSLRYVPKDKITFFQISFPVI